MTRLSFRFWRIRSAGPGGIPGAWPCRGAERSGRARGRLDEHRSWQVTDEPISRAVQAARPHAFPCPRESRPGARACYCARPMCPPASPELEPAPDAVALIDPRRVGVVVPAWNETGKIGEVVRKVSRRWAATVIVVDDHSDDDTA